MDTEQQGWAPTSYVEEIKQPVNGMPKKKPPPPPPTGKRPNIGKKPAAAATHEANDTPANGNAQGGSFAGGLAQALKQRQAAMREKDDDDDDW